MLTMGSGEDSKCEARMVFLFRLESGSISICFQLKVVLLSIETRSRRLLLSCLFIRASGFRSFYPFSDERQLLNAAFILFYESAISSWAIDRCSLVGEDKLKVKILHFKWHCPHNFVEKRAFYSRFGQALIDPRQVTQTIRCPRLVKQVPNDRRKVDASRQGHPILWKKIGKKLTYPLENRIFESFSHSFLVIFLCKGAETRKNTRTRDNPNAGRKNNCCGKSKQ
ncbi:hypothetical protein VNO77_46341 [Canavalia gladiata]|uniref:Uncharacterized protein n=1 Tax=Canavalia gladiata TaxID=3824 RepID=A0AAN9PFU7_CANGL